MAHITIVGAGLAGLAAACTLHDRGNEVTVLEASDGVGGRVRTDEVDGYLLDRGFQILLTSYPVAQRVFDFEALDLRRFQAGAFVQLDSGRVLIGDPIRRSADLLDTVRAPVGTFVDKTRLLAWRRSVMSGSVDELWAKPECTSNSRLSDLKFSDAFVEQFLEPLFSGITLDPKLEVTSRFTEFMFRMLSTGYGAVPANGMGKLGEQLAAKLPDGSVQLSAPVESVTATTVTTAGGEVIETDAVIVATDMTASSKLVDTPDLGWNGVTTRWYASDVAPYTEPLLFLNGTREGRINNVAVMSNVSPTYAPVGKHLTAVSYPGIDGGTDVDRGIAQQLRGWFGGAVADWELLRTDVIEHAQPRHLPGENVPATAKLESDVFVAGDHRQNPSINGALQSGRSVARSVLEFVHQG
ncbi:MAG: phytoene dehydrogenase-like protein [Verrucomicrobiales bacterium]|jgi:phytoene dehydrogenase-like protein